MKKKIFLILICCFLSAHVLLGQQYYSRNYTINEGLPNNNVQDILKDSRGFLWIGTDAGLARFDGKNFVIYNSQNGLAGERVSSITESSRGNIWIGCQGGGISKITGNSITSYNTNDGLVSNDVLILFYSNHFNLLFIGTGDGLSVYDSKEFISFHKKLNNVTQRLQITDFIEQKDFVYVFTNGNGLYKYIPDAKTLLRVPSDHPLNLYQVNSAYISTNNDTLINYNRKKLIHYKNSTKSNSDFIGRISDYREDSDSNIWLGAQCNNYVDAGGLFKLSDSGLINFGKYLGIKSRNIQAVEYDSREDLLWIGTKENGLYLYPIRNFAYYKAEEFGLDHFNIQDLHVDKDNNLWILTKNNIIKKNTNNTYKLFSIDLFQKSFKRFINTKFENKYSYLTDKNGSYIKYQNLISSGLYTYSNPYKKLNGEILPAKSLYKPLKYDVYKNKTLNEFNSIISDTLGNIWIGSNVGIFKVNAKTEKINYFDISCNAFNKFYFDLDNKLYAACWADLFVFPSINKNNSHFIYNYYEQLSPINVAEIIARKDEVWFASNDHGIFLLKNNKFYSTFEQKSLETSSFNCLCLDKKGNAIAGGNNGKIYALNIAGDSIIKKFEIGNQKGLNGTSIRYLKCTDNNTLIAGTNKGVSIIDLNTFYRKQDLIIKNIDESFGFTDYSGNVSVLDKEGNIWIGSNENLIRFDLKQLDRPIDTYFDFYIQSIEINDENIDLNNKFETDVWTNIPKSNIKLPYHKNSITFNFEVISYLNPKNISFSYKLEGYQKNWTQKTKETKAIFQNLKPGKYRLRIKIISPDKTFTNHQLSIGFEIMSPLWNKWWFIITTIIITIFTIWLIIFLRTRSIKKKERLRSEIAERITEFEMKALRAQMNPHFIFNAINSIQNYMLDNDVDTALNYLSDFAKLIRLTLDNVSKKQVSLDEELNYLKYYLKLEQMRFDKKFETEVILPPEYENSSIMIPPMILQPYVENSIKHGFIFKDEGGKIRLEFEISEDNILKCIIEDNGVGREKSRELNKGKKGHKPKGTFITNERLALLNQTKKRKGYKVEIIDLYDESNNARGTRVEIYIPV